MRLQPETTEQENIKLANAFLCDLNEIAVCDFAIDNSRNVIAFFRGDVTPRERIYLNADDLGVNQRHQAPTIQPVARAPAREKRDTNIGGGPMLQCWMPGKL